MGQINHKLAVGVMFLLECLCTEASSEVQFVTRYVLPKFSALQLLHLCVIVSYFIWQTSCGCSVNMHATEVLLSFSSESVEPVILLRFRFPLSIYRPVYSCYLGTI